MTTSNSRPSLTLEALIHRYIDDRVRRHRFRNRTPVTVRSNLLLFAESVGPDLPATSLTRRQLERWILSLEVAPSTTRHKVSTVRAFCQWLSANDHIRSDPSRGLDVPRLPRSVPRGMKINAVSRLYSVLPDARAELIVSLMVQEGLRCVEVANLQLGDVDRAEGLLFIRGKGGHGRVLPLTSSTRRALNVYLSQHPATNGPLIRRYSRRGDGSSLRVGMDASYYSKLVSSWMKSAGLKSHIRDGISAHALRHTAATDMLRSGAHLRDVQAALGHASLATTQRYLPTVVHDLRIAMEGREYRNPKPAPEPDPTNIPDTDTDTAA